MLESRLMPLLAIASALILGCKEKESAQPATRPAPTAANVEAQAAGIAAQTGATRTISNSNVRVHIKDPELEMPVRQLVDRIGGAHIAQFVIHPGKPGAMRHILPGNEFKKI